jgi:hypothetical protein
MEKTESLLYPPPPQEGPVSVSGPPSGNSTYSPQEPYRVFTIVEGARILYSSVVEPAKVGEVAWAVNKMQDGRIVLNHVRSIFGGRDADLEK